MNRISRSLNLTILLFFFLLCLLLITVWFHDGNLFIGAEEGIIFYRLDYILEKMVNNVWLDLYLGIPYLSDLSKRPLYSIMVVFNDYGVSGFFLQLSTFFLILLGASIGIYYLFKLTFEKISGKNTIAFFGAIFYLSNPYVISQVWARGLYPQFFAYLYYPIFLIPIVLFLKTRRIEYLLLDLLVSFILSSAMGNPTYFVSLWILVSAFWVYTIWDIRKNFNLIVFYSFTYFLFFLGWLVINSWWLAITIVYAPAVYLTSGSVFENSIESLRSVSNQNPFANVIRLYHGPHFEANSYGQIYKHTFFVFLSLLAPFVVFCSLGLRKEKIYKLYGGLFLLGLFVCLGSNYPFGIVFEFIFSQVTPLQVFRNPYEKFGLVYLLSYSALFGMGSLVLIRFLDNYKKNLGILIAYLILFLVSGVYSFPLWTGQVISWGTTVEIPDYYQKLDEWQNFHNGNNERILFLPLLAGHGASYKWIGGDYKGIAPLNQITDASVISNSNQNEYLNALRRYKGSLELTTVLAMARIGYIFEQRDVVSVARDKFDTGLMTQVFYNPSNVTSELVCDEKTLMIVNDGWICEVPENQQNMTDVYYVDILFTNQNKGFFDVYLLDKTGQRPRWNGQRIKEYQYLEGSPDEVKTIRVYLNDPTENPDTDFSGIKKIEIYPKSFDNSPDNNVILQEVRFNKGSKGTVTGIEKTDTVAGMPIFKVVDPQPVDEFGVINQIEYVGNYQELFEESKLKKDLLNSTGFLIEDKNQGKPRLDSLEGSSVVNRTKINETRYLAEFSNNNEQLLVINKSFNQEWKLVTGVNKKELSGGFLNDIKLFLKRPIDEENHYMVNGYANLWRVDPGESRNVAIVYKPQILMDILWRISFLSFIVVLLVTLWLLFKKRIISFYGRFIKK